MALTDASSMRTVLTEGWDTGTHCSALAVEISPHVLTDIEGFNVRIERIVGYPEVIHVDEKSEFHQVAPAPIRRSVIAR